MIKAKVGDVIEDGPYCTLFAKFVEENCWENCSGYCRFREVMIDENVSKPRGYVRNGYADGKWKDMKNYRYTGKAVITSEYEY